MCFDVRRAVAAGGVVVRYESAEACRSIVVTICIPWPGLPNVGVLLVVVAPQRWSVEWAALQKEGARQQLRLLV